MITTAMLLSPSGCGQDDMPIEAVEEASERPNLLSSNDRQSQPVAPPGGSPTSGYQPEADEEASGQQNLLSSNDRQSQPVAPPGGSPPSGYQPEADEEASGQQNLLSSNDRQSQPVVPSSASVIIEAVAANPGGPPYGYQPEPTPSDHLQAHVATKPVDTVADARAPRPSEQPAPPLTNRVAALVSTPPPANSGYPSDCRLLNSAAFWAQCRESRFIEWSSDGEQILFGFVTEETPYGDPPIVHTAQADGSALRPLLATPHELIRTYTLHFSLSPDGSTLVHNYWETGRIASTNASTGETRMLTDTQQHYNYPVWSPDGSQIAFASLGPLVDPGPGIYVMGPAGSGLRNLTPLEWWPTRDPAIFPTSEYAPQWSPDGSRIAFSGYRAVLDWYDGWDPGYSGNGDPFGENHPCDQPNADPDLCYMQGLFVVEVNGLGLNLVQEGAIAPSWSPDGKRIAYAGRHGEEEVALFIINVDGTDRRMVAIISDLDTFHSMEYLHGRLETLTWSPAGEHIMYSCYYGAICVLSLRTGDAWFLPQTGVAAWSPDGSRIAVRGHDLISTMGPSGGDVRHLAKLYHVRDKGVIYYTSFLIGLGISGEETCFNGVIVPDIEGYLGLERIDLPRCDED